MPLVIIGVLLLAAKWADVGPTAAWSWWWVLSPFAGAVAWWAFSDATGITQRRAMRKMDERKAERRERSMAQLGLDTRRKGIADKASADAKRRADTMAGSTGKRSTGSSEPRL
jgi:small Trp-rich protein